MPDKHDRSIARDEMTKSLIELLEDSFPDESKNIKSVLDDRFKNGYREQILATGKGVMAEKTDDIREITVETDILKRTHGSALFTRGETQALVVTTLGSKSDEMIVDSMDEDYKNPKVFIDNFHPIRLVRLVLAYW